MLGFLILTIFKKGISMGKIIEFPDDKKLKEKLKNLKETLSDLVLERDNLYYVVCENIKTQYMLIFGSLEYKVFSAFCKYHRLRRKKALIQARINRKEKIDLSEIESILDLEFAEYKKKLDKKMDEINHAIFRSHLEVLSRDDTILLKKLYRKIVRALHPDLNPELSDREKELFYNATESYKLGDLDTLQLIYDIVCTGDMDDDSPLSGKSLMDEVKRLEDLVQKIQNDIDLIKSQSPYTWKIYVEDEDKKLEKIKDFENDLKSYQEAIKTQEEYIEELLRK